MPKPRREYPYPRFDHDSYDTPDAATDALFYMVTPTGGIWEPCAGTGRMLDRIRHWGCKAYGTDLVPRRADIGQCDFSRHEEKNDRDFPHIITNPPYARGLCADIVATAIEHARLNHGLAALLLPAAWMAAGERARFAPSMTNLIHISPRIRWLEGTDLDKGNDPLQDHAWHLWDCRPAHQRLTRPFYHVNTKRIIAPTPEEELA